MSPRKEINNNDRVKICTLREEGYTLREIANVMNVPIFEVDRKQSGCPKVKKPYEEHLLIENLQHKIYVCRY